MTDPEQARRHDIDALRVLATLLLIVFHSGMLFTAYDTFHIQNLERSEVVGEMVGFIHQWHMPLFFLLAGMSAWFALRTRTSGRFRSERFKRLIVPLAFGMLLIVPIQVYIERISTWVPTRRSPIDFEGTFFEWYPNTFRCCYPDANLSWHHLWFLAYLFVYSVLLVGLFVWLRGRGEPRRLAVTGFLSRGWNLLLIPAAYLGVAEAALRTSFPNNQDLVSDLANHANYPVVLLLGYLLVSDPLLDDALRRLWGWALPLGVAVILLPDVTLRFDHATRGVAEWLVLVGLAGLGRRVMHRPVGWISRFSEISLPFYIWHQTVIVVIAYFVLRWEAPISAKYLIVASCALVVTWVLSEAVALTNPTRALFGLRPRSRTTAAAP
jgi:peptidoglycan/LPS O-acetylase OafA/YrhL